MPKRIAATAFVLLWLLWAPLGTAYVEQTRSVASAAFQNGWGSAPQAEWYVATDLYREGRLEELAELLSWMLTTGEFDEVLVRRNLAIVYKDLGAYPAAADEYRKLVLRAGNPKDQTALGWTLLQTGAHAEALSAFEAVVQRGAADPWTYYGLALTYEALGRHEEALAAYASATALDDRFAPAYYHAGRLRERLGDLEGARAAMARAISLDPSLTELYMPLARVNEALGNLELAWRYYRSASLRYPSDPGAKAAVERLAAQHGEVLRALEAQENAARLAAAQHRTVQPVADPERIPTVRVGLAENQARIRFSSGGPFRVLSLTGRELWRGEGRGAIWTAERTAGGVRLLDPAGQVRVDARDGFRVVQTDPTQTFIVYDMVFGQGYFFATIEHRQYRGELEFLVRPSGLTLVNIVNLEEYLYSVVPSEMYATMPVEALKVQAMAARTYTLRSLGRYASRGFDVLGSVASSEYRGVDREHPNSTAAVDATRGLVLRYGGQLIEALYSADHGGHSAASAEVWGGAQPYLQARLDADPEGAPEFPLTPDALDRWLRGLPEVYASTSGFGLRSTFRWVHVVPAERIQAIIDGRAANIGRIVRVIPRSRSVGGHVSRVEFVGTKGSYFVTGDAIRSVLGGIKSNLFRIEVLYGADGYPREYLIIGGGSGHGVGLSQLGAAGRALAGQTAEEIIAHYYPGATVHRAY